MKPVTKPLNITLTDAKRAVQQYREQKEQTMRNPKTEKEAAFRAMAALAAAISLLEAGGKQAKKAAPSDRMFDQMIKDYKQALTECRDFFFPDREKDEDE